MQIKSWRGLLSLFVLSLLLCSCSPKSLKIGVALPLSGNSTSRGQEILNAVLLAVEEINQQGGIQSQPVEIELADDRDLPERAQIAAQELVDKKVIAVIGHYSSDATLAALPIYQQAGIPLISPSVTLTHVPYEGQYFFRTVGNNKQQAIRVKEMIQSLDYQRIALVHNSSQYAKDLINQVESQLQGLPLQIKRHDETEAEAMLQDFANFQPEIIFYAGGFRSAAPLLQRFRDAGIHGDFMGSNTLHDPEFVRLAGLRYVKQSWVLSNTEQGPDFRKRYQQRFGAPGPFSFSAYQAALLLMQSAQVSPNLKANELLKQLKRLAKGFQKPAARETQAFDIKQVNSKGEFIDWHYRAPLAQKLGKTLGIQAQNLLKPVSKAPPQNSK